MSRGVTFDVARSCFWHCPELLSALSRATARLVSSCSRACQKLLFPFDDTKVLHFRKALSAFVHLPTFFFKKIFIFLFWGYPRPFFSSRNGGCSFRKEPKGNVLSFGAKERTKRNIHPPPSLPYMGELKLGFAETANPPVFWYRGTTRYLFLYMLRQPSVR